MSKVEEKKRRESLKGSFVGNYEILQTIGEGSFAKVKLAKHKLTHQKVAIKVIDKTKLPDEYAVKNMYREAQIMRILDHPNIIKLFEVMETKKNLFLILEYAPKGEFLEYIITNGKVDEDEAKRFTKQIIAALEHAHSHNIVHRDLKAENFLLDEKLNIKLSDFGLSNFFDPSKLLGTFCGSPVYSAPELIEGKKYTGPEVDAWSLGINVYAMVVGDLPFADSNLAALYDSIIKGNYTIPDFVTDECRDFISKLLMVNPKKRARINQLMDHSWLSGQITFLDSVEEKVPTFRPQAEEEIDMSVVEILEKFGLEKKTVIQGVLTGKFNQAAGLYFLLSHQKTFGSEELHFSTFSLDGIKKTSENGKEKEGKDLSEELAQVLFQVERQRGSTVTKRHGVTEKPPKSSNTQAHVPDSHVVQLPRIQGAQPIEHYLLKVQPLNVPQIKGATTTTTSATLSPEIVPTSRRESTKFGLTKHNATDKKIPVDETLYQAEEKTGDKNGPRTIKYAFNCFCHTKLHPAIFFEKLYSVLDKNDIQWYNDDYLCACEWGDIKFETEICKLPRQPACGIRLKRINGDIWEFKKLSSKITGDLDNISA